MAVVIAAVSVLAFVYTRHSQRQQESILVRSNAAQASLYVGSVFNGIGSVLDTLAATVALTNGSPSAFVARAQPQAQGNLAYVLAHRQGDSYVVDAAVGPGFHAGQVLSPTISATMAKAGSKFLPAPVVYDGRTSTAGFAVGPPLVPTGLALYFQFSLNPFVASPVTAAKPFASLKVAIYGGSTADTAHLVVATSHALPLTDAVVEHTAVGGGTWTLVAAARSPLTGSFANEAPYIILVLGIFMALLVGTTVEILVRRQRYAAEVVTERTADLNQSLADLRDAQAALVRGERLTALGEMASVVGHELRNPLAAVTNALYLLRRVLGEPADPGLEKHLAMAERETAKAASLAEDLTAFVRPREPQLAGLQLEEVVHEVVEATPPPPNVALSVDVQPVEIVADRRQLAEVLTNLVTNAYQAVGDGGSVRISAHPNASGAVIAVEDTGPGIDVSLADRVFEPFFTTKHDGTGLGLAIVRRLIEAHGGEVAFESVEAGHGARVVVHLPNLAEEAVS
ncbi:MAG: sensor histidine kinase [Acidimicrobiales bacterium]